MRALSKITVPLFLCVLATPALGQQTGAATTGAKAAQQTETDEYTRYDLLGPDSASFKIYYEVTATAPGATSFYNPIRKGSAASDESVIDSMTGQPLKFEVVSGAEARKDPLMSDADADTSFIKIALARPVPPAGQGRVLILKTYQDAKSYYRDGDAIVFHRPLGIKRNKVVLPAGYELTACNVPSQVLQEPDVASTATNWSSTAASAGPAMPSFFPPAGISPPAPFPPPSPNSPTAASASTSGTAAPTPSTCS